MPKQTSILVCGDAGLAREALLARRDIHVFWEDSIQGALATTRVATPQVCIARAHLRDGSAVQLLRALKAAGGPPCVVLLGRSEWAMLSDCFSAGAADVVELEQAQAILQALADYTGLTFAKEQRTSFEAVVEVDDHDDHLVLETADISASGVSIRGFPEAPAGHLVRLSFVLQSQSISLWARVVRCWKDETTPMAGLRFVGLTEGQVSWLRKGVETHAALRAAGMPRVPDLFADLRIVDEAPGELDTEELGLPDVPSEDCITVPDALIELLGERLLTERAPDRLIAGMPEWMATVVASLTPVEQAAAVGEPTPGWAFTALNARIKLRRARSSSAGGGALPPALAEQAYQLFVGLARAGIGQPDDIAAQVAEIRANLLREILGKCSRTLSTQGVATGSMRALASA